jgi:hypothetical protein
MVVHVMVHVDFELCEALRARMATALTGHISESFFVRGPCKQPASNVGSTDEEISIYVEKTGLGNFPFPQFWGQWATLHL